MRNLSFLALCLVLLVLQSSLFVMFSFPPFEPQLLLPVAIYLGVSQNVRTVRGAALSFVIGYMVDIFCGSPMGIQTFVMVATFLVARLARFKILLRGPIFQVGLTFAIVALAGGITIVFRGIFEKTSLLPFPSAWVPLRTLFGSALATAVVAPLVTWVFRRTELPSLQTG